MWIVQIALRRPYTFLVAAILILLSTPFVLRAMPTDIFPAIDIPVVAMLWDYKGMNAKEISDRLAGSVERSMSLIDGIEHSESLSFAGSSVIKVFFHPDTDIRTAIAQVMSSSNSVYRSLPANTAPPQIIQYSASDLPLVQLGVSSSTVPETEVNDLVNNILRNALQSKPGVAVTYPFGSKSRQVTIDIDAPALTARGIEPADLADALAEQNLILPTGTLKIGETEYDVILNGAVADIPHLGDIPVRTGNGGTAPGASPLGATTLVRDIANVRDGAAPVTTLARQNGERGILNSVFKRGRISTLEVIEHVKQTIPKMLAQMPDGINMRLMFDQSLFVRAAIGNVIHEALIAACLTAAMILLFLGNWRSTLIIAVSIPLAIMCSLIALHLAGETINLMTTGGLALAVGILVDDATVEIENIERQMLMGKTPYQAILDGAAEIALPAFVSTLCICIVFAPMFFLTGVARSLFAPMAEAVVFAMLASYLLSRTLVPTLVMYMMSGRDSRRGSRRGRPAHAFRKVFHAFERGFESAKAGYVALLSRLLSRRRRCAGGFMLFFGLSAGLIPLLGRDLFPVVDAGQIRLHVRAPTGTRIEEMPALIDEVENFIRSRIPARELQDMLDIIGGPYSTRNTLFGNSGTVEAADTEIMISLRSGAHAPSADYIKRLRAELPGRFPKLEFFFQPADQISQTLNFGIPAPIDIQFLGGKASEVMPLVIELNNRLRAIPGLVDVHVYQRANRPALDLELNRTQLHQLGLSARDVAQNLLLTLSGSMQTAPSYWLNPANGNTVNIGIMGNPLALDSIDALMRTSITGNNKTPQLLGNLVTLKRTFQPAAVTHYNGNNMFNIHANVEDRDLGSIGNEIRHLLDDYRNRLPRGVELTVRGQIQTLHDSFRGLTTGLGVSVVLLYFLLVVNFQSWLDAFIIVSGLPAALAGIAWMLFLTGTALSIPALTGCIMAMGVVTANTILLVSFARNRLGDGAPAVTAALEAAATRLRPVLMTALAMIVGMLPMALGWGEGAEQNAPLGRAVIGGLIFATVSTLLFVPLVFAGCHRRLAQRSAGRHRFATLQG